MKTLILVFGFLVASVCSAEMKPNEAMMKYMAPGDGHKPLAEMVGNWKYTMKMWMEPNAKAEESKGTAKSKLVMGGRFLQEDVKAKMGQMTFEGVSLLGYDNMKQSYQSIWYDNMGTGMMVGEGKMADGTMKAEGTFSCPMTNDPNRKFRSEMKVVDKNHHVFSMYLNDKDGKEFKNLEISYSRAGK